MKNIILGILLLAVSGTASFAAEPTRKVQFRTLCLKQIEGLEKVAIPSGKNLAKNQDLTLFTDLSPIVAGVFKNNEAVFYSFKPGPDGKPMRVAVGKTALGKSTTQLFVFLPAEDGEGKLAYQVRAYDDDAKSFALGTVRAINLASVPFRFVMTDATIPSILPGTFAQFPQSKTVNEYNLYPVSVDFQTASGEWEKFQSVSWKASDKKRDLVITSENLKTKVRAIQMFSDVPPKAAR